MSECSTYISSAPGQPIKAGSPGKAATGPLCMAILPVEAVKNRCRRVKSGLLAVHRSDPGLMLGYWNRPDEEELVYRGDWFHWRRSGAFRR
jgi:acyl-coenzyme A synthetase/AMP-(fatty) acid ligase